MTSQTETPDYLNFKKIKDEASVRVILADLGLLDALEERGAELIGWCPLGTRHGKRDSFAFNTEKKVFQCFACKAKGTLLDFIAKYEGGECTVREAARYVYCAMRSASFTGLCTVNGNEEAQVETLRRERELRQQSDRKFEQGQEKTRQEQGRIVADIEPRRLGSAVMSFRLARSHVDKGRLNPDRLVVVDTQLLDVLQALMRSHVKNN